MKRSVPILAAVILALAALCGRAFSDPVPMELLRNLKRGMTQDEVRSLLGNPTRIYGSQWTYRRQLVFGFVNIHWQADGTYDGEFNHEQF